MPRQWFHRKCDKCKKEFSSLRENARFCSDGCRHAYHSNTEKHEDRECLLCEKTFKVKNVLQKFCSSKHRDEWHMWKKRFEVMDQQEKST